MKFLITAGPTREPIDPVRFLSNRSSGKMGYALAEAARDRGHEVVLVSGPVALPAPQGVERISVETARQMFDVVQQQIVRCDVAIFSAAVADYRPTQVRSQKIKKDGDALVLKLEKTEDILGHAREAFGFTGFLVGFAAETENLVPHAQAKLHRKGCDLIIANDVSQSGIGFDADENAVSLCWADGRVETWERQSKEVLAAKLLPPIEVGMAARLQR